MRLKKLFPVVIALMVAAMAWPAAAQEAGEPVTVYFEVSGLHCPRCAESLKAFVEEMEGVLEVSASFEDSRLIVTFDPALQSVETLKEAVAQNTGFQIEELPDEADAGK